jgi:hypothetical protein
VVSTIPDRIEDGLVVSSVDRIVPEGCFNNMGHPHAALGKYCNREAAVVVSIRITNGVRRILTPGCPGYNPHEVLYQTPGPGIR